MKTVLTTDEWERFLEYRRLEVYRPCNRCPDKSSCCGCPAQTEYQKKLIFLDIPDNLKYNDTLRKLADLYLQIEINEKKIAELQLEHQHLLDELDNFSKDDIVIGSSH